MWDDSIEAFALIVVIGCVGFIIYTWVAAIIALVRKTGQKYYLRYRLVGELGYALYKSLFTVCSGIVLIFTVNYAASIIAGEKPSIAIILLLIMLDLYFWYPPIATVFDAFKRNK